VYGISYMLSFLDAQERMYTTLLLKQMHFEKTAVYKMNYTQPLFVTLVMFLKKWA